MPICSAITVDQNPFFKSIPLAERLSSVRVRRGAVRRYWERLIRDEDDYRARVDYAHINPVTHGLVGRVVELIVSGATALRLPPAREMRQTIFC